MSLRPADGVELLLLDDSGVLFDARHQEILSLDAMGALIWRLMRDHGDPARITDALAAQVGLLAAQAQAYFEQARADWSARGLLHGTTRPAAPVTDHHPTSLPSYPGPHFAAESHYRFRNLAITVRFSAQAHADIVRPLFTHLAIAPERSNTDIDIVAIGDRIVLYQDRVPYGACQNIRALAPLAKNLFWKAGLDAGNYLLNIHAGVVEGVGGCVLLAAPPGHGKSTLTAALVHVIAHLGSA